VEAAREFGKLDSPGIPTLFSTPPDQRRRFARPVLLELREVVRHGTSLLDALFAVEGDLLHREYARHELIAVLPYGLTLAAVGQEQDLSLLVLQRALVRCTPVQVVRSGGWSISRRRSA
jgi:hypothetical protein